jgi:hypothetical protein
MMIFPKKYSFLTSAHQNHQKAPKSINLMLFSGNKRFEKNFDKQIQPQKQTHPGTLLGKSHMPQTLYIFHHLALKFTSVFHIEPLKLNLKI